MTEITAEALQRAIRWDMCLTCGEKLTKWRANVLSPSMALTRRADRPQMHQSCARDQAMAEKGTVLLWLTREKSTPGMHSPSAASFQLPAADAIQWFTDGRDAYRDEAIMALKGVILPLLEACNEDEREFRELGSRVRALAPQLPRHSSPNVGACIQCKTPTDSVDVIGCTMEGCPLFEVAEA